MSESQPPQLEANSRTGEPDATSESELRRLIAAHEARLAEVVELAARVRHDINNQLTGLMGQSQLLLREPLSDSARRRVQIIEQLAGRIRDAVVELRAAERLTYTPIEGPETDSPRRT
ncbi:MAG: histidine kinase dimerization/phospho-acceptor domain-containing protein [Pyrinomonadaceae bacterium]